MSDSTSEHFRPYIGLTVRRAFRRGERCEFFPQRGLSEYVLWIESDDGKRLNRIQDVEIAPVVAVLRNLQIPLIDRSTGFDLNTYTLTFGHSDRVQLSWEGFLPAEWNALTPALIQIHKLSGIDFGSSLTDERV